MKQKVHKNVWLRISMLAAVMLAFVGTTRAEIHPIDVELEGFTATSGKLDENIAFSTTNGSYDAEGVLTAKSLTLTAAHGAKINAVTFHYASSYITVRWNATNTNGTGTFAASLYGSSSEQDPELTGLSCDQLVFKNENGGTFIIDYIKVTYTPATPEYVITALSSDDSKGSVEVDGNVIIATPNYGYGVDESNPYTITAGEATVTTYVDNEFDVVPTSNCTIVINFVPHVADSKVNFEHALDSYTDWEHGGTIVRSQRYQGENAHGGKGYYGITNANTAWMKTVNKIGYPGTFTCYVRRTQYQSSLTWKIQVSSNGSNWTDVKTYSPSGTAATSWEEFSADLSQHTDVYVRLYYTGNGANGAIDDINLHTHTVLVDPEIQLAGAFYGSTTAKFTCVSDGVTYYYSFNANTPLDEWTACDGDEVEITQTTTIYMYAARGTHRTNVVSASTVCLDEPITVTIGSAEYATFVAPANLSLPDGMIALIVTGASASSVAIEEITDIPANTAVVLNAAPGTYTFTVIASATSDVSGNLLKASDGTKQGAANIFCLANKEENGVGFYPVANTVTIPAGKAYLEVPVGEDNGNGNVKAFLGFEEDATAIAEVAAKAMNTTAIYNIAGQRLQKMQKGINIVNGKKVLF